MKEKEYNTHTTPPDLDLRTCSSSLAHGHSDGLASWAPSLKLVILLPRPKRIGRLHGRVVGVDMVKKSANISHD